MQFHCQLGYLQRLVFLFYFIFIQINACLFVLPILVNKDVYYINAGCPLLTAE